jgi:hypothetical protein
VDVANREVWTIGRVHGDGSLAVAGERGGRVLPAGYAREHVELGYASTAHGAQRGTATTAHLALGEHTTAATGYVGMTRGREANTVHLIATDLTTPATDGSTRSPATGQTSDPGTPPPAPRNAPPASPPPARSIGCSTTCAKRGVTRPTASANWNVSEHCANVSRR